VRWWLQDACSTDDSFDIASRYRTCEDVIQVEPDRGQADALNKAFARMNGDIIGFLNSDDMLAEDAAAIVLKTFDENPQVDLVYGEVEWMDEGGNIIGRHVGNISSYEEIIDVYSVWWKNRQWVQPEVFFRRALFDRVGHFNTSLDLAFDYEYWVRCFAAGARTKRIPKVLARFRIHAGQKSSRSEQASKEIRGVVAHWLCHRPPSSKALRSRVSTELAYDAWRLMESEESTLNLPMALCLNPRWLKLPQVRERLMTSLRQRFLGDRRL
jgi:glycosyltransferase involved in cell wall biosynthesis